MSLFVARMGLLCLFLIGTMSVLAKADTDKPRLVLPTKGGAEAIAFSPTGKWLAACGLTGPIERWDTTTWRRSLVYSDNTETARSLAFSPDDRWLAAGTTDGAIRLFDTQTGRPRLPWRRHRQETRALGFSPDGRYLASGGGFDNFVCIWDVSTGRLVKVLPQQSYARSVIFSPDGRLLALPSGNAVMLYETVRWQAVKMLPLPQGESLQKSPGIVALSLAFSPDGNVLAVAVNNLAVTLWDVSTGRLIHTLPQLKHGAEVIAFSPDGKLFATASAEATIYFTNPVGPRTELTQLSEGTVRLWRTGDWSLLNTFRADAGNVYALAFSQDSRLLATSSGVSVVKIWDVPEIKPERGPTEHE